MNTELEVLGVKLRLYRLDTAMEKIEEFLSNDRLNTVGMVTMQMLMQAQEDEKWKTYIQHLDMTVVAETELLDAAGINPEGIAYQEVAANEFVDRLFWKLIRKSCRLFILGDTRSEVQSLETYLRDNYHGIDIVGNAVVDTEEEADVETVINEINSETTDVIVSGLAGTRQDQFVLANSEKISAKILFSLGEHTTIQNEAGIKTSWWGTLLKRSTFKRRVIKFNSEKDE